MALFFIFPSFFSLFPVLGVEIEIKCVILTSSKVLSREKVQENLGFLLAYSYLCSRYLPVAAGMSSEGDRKLRLSERRRKIFF